MSVFKPTRVQRLLRVTGRAGARDHCEAPAPSTASRWAELPPCTGEDEPRSLCRYVQGIAGRGGRARLGSTQLWAGGPRRSSVAKPQPLAAVFVKPDGNGLFCSAFV